MRSTAPGMSILVVALVAFAFGFVGSMPLAGPISVLVVSTAFDKRFADAMKVTLGASIAEGAYAFAAFWGFATFLAKHKSIVPIAHAVTAFVLLAVGGYFVRWKPKRQERSERKPGFFVGLSIAAANPTLLVTWSTVVAWVYAHRLVEMTGALAIPWGIAAALGVGAWNLVVIELIRRFHEKFPRRAIKWIVRAMGLVLIAMSAWSAVEFVQYFTK